MVYSNPTCIFLALLENSITMTSFLITLLAMRSILGNETMSTRCPSKKGRGSIYLRVTWGTSPSAISKEISAVELLSPFETVSLKTYGFPTSSRPGLMLTTVSVFTCPTKAPKQSLLKEALSSERRHDQAKFNPE